MSRQSGRLREPLPTPSPYAGPTRCLRCDAAFESWDRRHNRICPRCREAMAEQPSDEPSATIDRPALRAAHMSAFRRRAG
jgi:predicted amidophosphoribosyltransferase